MWVVLHSMIESKSVKIGALIWEEGAMMAAHGLERTIALHRIFSGVYRINRIGYSRSQSNPCS